MRDAAHEEQAELNELLRGWAEAMKLTIDRTCALLSFLLTRWFEHWRTANAASERLPAKPDEGLLTVKEAAQFLGVTPRTIYNFNRTGKLKPLYVGNEPRYERRQLEALLEKDTARRRVKLIAA